MTANVSPALSGVSPTGSVEFEDTDGTELGIAPISLSGGGASLTLQNMGSGQHVISTLYSGDVNFQPNSVVDGNVLVQVQGTPVTIIATPNTVLYKSAQQTTTGWNIAVTVNTVTTVKNVPTGTVSVYFYTPSGAEYYVSFGGSRSTAISQTGTYSAGVSFTLTDPSLFLTPGVYEFYAVYNTGGNDQSGSSSNEQFTITLDPSTTTLTCTNPVVSRGSTSGTGTCTATVSNTSGDQISGLVDFSVNGGTATAVTLPTGGSPQSVTYKYTTTGDSDSDGDIDATVTATYMGNSNLSSSSATWTSSDVGTDLVDIDTGGAAAAPYAADKDYVGGNTANTATTISTTGVSNPAPQAVYQSERWGASTYTIPGLTSGTQYSVVLHFAEIYWTAAGQREFNVLINGTQVLTNFDVFAAAGGEYKAITETFTATANASGQIVIQFTVGAADQPKISGIQIQTVGLSGAAQSRPMAASSSTTNSSFHPYVFSQNGGAANSSNGGITATIQPMQAGQSGNGNGNGGSGSGNAPQAQGPHRVMSHHMAP
jgi:hypothetical protein